MSAADTPGTTPTHKKLYKAGPARRREHRSQAQSVRNILGEGTATVDPFVAKQVGCLRFFPALL
jgi:hypothetical protein